MNIYQKLIEVRKTVPYLQKDKKNESVQKYSYVSSTQVLSNVRQKMDEVGLLLIPEITGHNLRESTVEQKNDKGDVFKKTTTYFTELDMNFTWVNADEPKETIVTKWYGQGVDIAGEKGVGKALTYAEKYFLLKYFNIATDNDDPDSFQDKHDDKNGKKDKTETEKKVDYPKKITDLLMTMANKDKSVALDLLEKYTTWTNSEGKEIKGKRTLQGMSEGALKTTYGKIKKDFEEKQPA